MDNKQIMQHMQEENFLGFLRRNYNQYWTTYADVHNDYDTGIDVKLDEVPYDLKVSNSKKITIFKKHNGEWYSPLTLHPEVDYLYVVEYDKCYMLYRIKKSRIIEYMLTQPQITEYTGDGNWNVCISLELDRVMEDVYVLRKERLVK